MTPYEALMKCYPLTLDDLPDEVWKELNPDNLTQSQLAKIFGVSRAMIGDIQLGKTYKQAGGIIRGKIKGRVPDGIRNQIRAEYQKGVRGCGRRALAKKYGIDRSTISRIVRES